MNENFHSLLRELIGEYYVECFEMGKSLAVIHGEQIEQFITLIPKVISFLEKELEDTATLQNIIQILKVYPQIDTFLCISKVIDTKLSLEEQAKQKETYIQRKTDFKFNLLLYQKAAANTILIQTITGDAENIYAYVLFCYFSILVDHLWEMHQVGIGIFNL